ncbi:putative (Heparan sulfate)-glucosamine 3-sulfotransferase 1 [Vibrio coralliirubri]|uniref:sulfotransferase family protein n=1 Tax=Vibrio coralliirubri TaxID=1516159 RepID=UPI000630B3A5|nr:sulfotransferase [Vibrio coralliirubri]CDT77913.1 putative (Heparan sulfate)-glucosamine 3-sulfotransferase 1 [Vibrio coralliirubri]
MNIKLRKFPYPYKAMLAISSDIDSTTPDSFEYIHETIKSPKNSIQLNFSDSIWMYARNSRKGKQLSFFDLDDEKLNPYWRKLKFYTSKGWIDTLHTYGNFSKSEASIDFSRKYAQKSVDFLKKHKINFDVWVNHGDENNIQNLGNYSYMKGATLDHDAYHYDLLKEVGVKYIWNPKKRDIFGHDSMLEPMKLRNGEHIWSFPRFHSCFVEESDKAYYQNRGAGFWGKDKNEAVLWHPSLLDLQITKDRLDKLCEDNQYSIVTQHFGNIKDTDNKFTTSAIETFKLLSMYSKEYINVVSTSKLLNYNRVNQFLDYEVIQTGRGTIINIKSIDDPILGQVYNLSLEQLDGITFYTDEPENTFFMVNGTLIKPQATKRNDSDGINKSISFFCGTMDIEYDISNRFDVYQEYLKKGNESIVDESKVITNDEKLTKKASISLWERALVRSKNFNKKGVKPNTGLTPAICIGGMKCGTSTLWDMLLQHPEVLACSVKEPSYFAVREKEQQKVEEYYSIWPWDNNNERKKVIFEASTHYSKFPASTIAAEQMKDLIPNTKIIYLVRDPIRRVESQLAHHISRGELSVDLLKGSKWKDNTHLFNLSRYYERILPYLTHLGKSNVLVITLEELIRDHKTTLAKVESFLSLSNFYGYSELKKSNPRREVLGADKVCFGSDDINFVYNEISQDIAIFAHEFNVNTKLWKTWSQVESKN